MDARRRMIWTSAGIALSLGAAAALAQSPAPPPAAAAPPLQPAPLKTTEFAPIFVGGNYVAFVSPQLVARNGTRAEGTMIQIVDPPAANGTVTAAMTQEIDCQAGAYRGTQTIMRDLKGGEIMRQPPMTQAAKPEAKSANEAFMSFVCTGKLKDELVPHFADLKAAYAGGKAVLERNRAAKAGQTPVAAPPPNQPLILAPKKGTAPKTGPSPAPPKAYGR